MVKVTIPKTEYNQLLEIKEKYKALKKASIFDLFEKPTTKGTKKIIDEFRSTGLYNEKFLKGLENGLSESSYFSQ